MKRFTLSLFTVYGLLLTFSLSAADRDTPERDGQYVQVTAGAAIDAGAMVAILPGDGKAYEAADTATHSVIGRAESSAALGATLLVKRGVFRWDNDGAFTKASIGQQCYVNDSEGVTTAAIASNDVIAGIIVDYDATGVWVDTYNQKITLTTSVASLAVSGAATVGTTLDVTGASTVGGALTVTGALTGRKPVITPVTLTATSLVLTAATHGGTVVLVNTNAAVAITLPANGTAAGTVIDVAVMGSDVCAPTISAATTDTLVGPNDVDLKSVTWGTGHRIGAYARFISDGAFWHVQNLAGTTMTYTD